MGNETNKISETGEQKISDRRKIELVFLFFLSILATAVITGSIVGHFQDKKISEMERYYQQQIRFLQTLNKQQPVQPAPVVSSDSDNETPGSELSPLQIGLDKIYVRWEKELTEVKENCGETDTRCFLVGKITNDDPKYKGKNFYLQASSTMGGFDMRHYIMEKSDDGTDVKAYVEGEGGEDSGAVIAGISDIPEVITFPGTSYQMKKHYLPSYLFSDAKAGNKVFYNKNIGDFFLTEEGCVVAELPDHTAIAYDLVIPFVDNESRVPDVTFEGGEKNTDEYEYIEPSCGGLCTHLSDIKADDLKPSEGLEIAGKTANGENIYRYKDPNNQKLQDLYNDKNTLAYYSDDFEGQEKNKYSYDEFIKLNPYFFWKDPLGRWISFKNGKFSSAAEMCKPVIYLYPEKKTDLELKLDISGILKYTDPPYGEGWKVDVGPDGKIKDLVSGEYRDYLLWEGVGLNYPKQNEGWVVKKEDLNSFFSDKLGVLGLNEKESNDFKDYWLSRLDEKPYYKVSFLSREQFEDLASVRFDPIKPDVFIRVMMTTEGLDSYENIPEQKLPDTPRRNGFTAVEWGGALLK